MRDAQKRGDDPRERARGVRGEGRDLLHVLGALGAAEESRTGPAAEPRFADVRLDAAQGGPLHTDRPGV